MSAAEEQREPERGGGVGVESAELLEVAEGVYAWVQPDGSWWINNTGYIRGRHYGVLIDTATTEARTRAFLDAVDDVSRGLPARWAVNTHHHGDHTFGNSLLPPETVVIGHHDTRQAFLADRTLENFPPVWSPTPLFGALERRAPDLTLSSTVTLHAGERPVDVIPVGYVAHTSGDVVVWVPDVRVLFVGDLLFPGHTPMIMAGEPSGALRVLDWITSFHADVVVPGHGAPVRSDELPKVIEEHRQYYEFVVREARRGLDGGLTALQVAQSTDLGGYADLHDPERFVLNVHSAYRELTGTGFDRLAALQDAVTWLGHPIPTKV